jgi:hypothetical protein
LNTYQARLGQRNASQRVSWELVGYKGWARVVSHVVAPYSVSVGGLPVGIQQATVRLRSTQRMRTGTVPHPKLKRGTTGDGKMGEDVVWGEPKEKTVTEYIVIQRQLVKGIQENWHVWGFAKEFDYNELKDPKPEKDKDEKNAPATN